MVNVKFNVAGDKKSMRNRPNSNMMYEILKVSRKNGTVLENN